MELTKLTIREIQKGLKEKEFSCVDLTKSFLDRIEEKKEIEIEIDDVKFTLVGKADIQNLVEKNDVCDFKTSETLTAEAKPWSIHQLQMYCHVFNKPVAYIVEPRKSDNNFWLEVIGKTLRDEDFFWQEMKKLAKFHKKLCKSITTTK